MSLCGLQTSEQNLISKTLGLILMVCFTIQWICLLHSCLQCLRRYSGINEAFLAMIHEINLDNIYKFGGYRFHYIGRYCNACVIEDSD